MCWLRMLVELPLRYHTYFIHATMKEFLKLFACMLLVFGIAIQSIAQEHTKMQEQDHAGHKLMNKEELQWSDGPAGLPAGAKLAVLSGDPAKEGTFTIRLMFPANYVISPHWHPTAEHITVIDGTFYMGMGEQLNKNSATSLQPGGFALMPAKSVHYGFTKAQTVVQVHGTGPFQITYINKADDPRNKEKVRQ